MKKILYVNTSLSHKRVFETFEPRDDVEQMVLGPIPNITSKNKIVPEDYSDFKIRNIKYYSNLQEIQKVVNSFKPSIYVEASLPIAKDIKLPDKCKKAYISHGMVGNHVIDLVKNSGMNASAWKGCDLYCGATSVFADWIKFATNAGDDKILLNALPQLDILYDPNYYNSYRQKVLSKTKFLDAKKVILFVGFCCKDRPDFDLHNEDYFRSVLELEEIARRNNWLVMVKPRHTYKKMIKFLQGHKWGKKYIKPYTNAQQSKHLHFITTTGHIYRYFFADAIVLNGTSTVEVEACAIKKPLFIVKTCLKVRTDPYNILNSSTVPRVTDLCELEHYLSSCFQDGRFHYPERQEKLINDMGIKFDGQMHKRVQDKLARM